MTVESARILVVGGAGFVGSALVRALLDRGAGEVLVVDNLLSAERSNLPSSERLSFVEASITDDDVLEGLPPNLDYAFHLATFHGNQNSMFDPLADHEHNTLTSLKLFHRLSECESLRRVVYSSAGCTVAQKTFDGAVATTEDDPVSLYLDSPYQISKVIGEFYGNYFQTRHGLPFVKARFQNVYGPGEILGAGQWRGTPATVWRNVTPTFVYKALAGQPLPVDNGGIATRDFIFVDDIAEGLVCCAERGSVGGVYNLASGVETSILELAETINEIVGNEAGVDLKPARDWDRSGQRYGAPVKAERDLGFVARTALRSGLEATIEWTRANMSMIEACMAKHADRLAAGSSL